MDATALRREVSEGLASWMAFEKLCGREKLFSERYLALPMAQLLSSNFPGRIEAEVNHPTLRVPGRRGRPPQVDFVVRENGAVTLAVETKWVGSTVTSVADVLWDCVRLELAAHHWGCETLFVIAGTRDRLAKVLKSRGFNPKGAPGKESLVMHLNGQGRNSVNIQSPKRDFGPALHKIMSGYGHVAYPRSFVCGAGAQVPRVGLSSAYSAIVWSIRPEAAAKRFTFHV